MTPALRLLFLDAWCVFNAWRSMGYASSDIFHGANHGRFFMVLRANGGEFNAEVGLVPDEFSDDACNEHWRTFLKEVREKLGKQSPRGTWPEMDAHWEAWRPKHAVDLLVRMAMRGFTVRKKAG